MGAKLQVESRLHSFTVPLAPVQSGLLCIGDAATAEGLAAVLHAKKQKLPGSGTPVSDRVPPGQHLLPVTARRGIGVGPPSNAHSSRPTAITLTAILLRRTQAVLGGRADSHFYRTSPPSISWSFLRTKTLVADLSCCPKKECRVTQRLGACQHGTVTLRGHARPVPPETGSVVKLFFKKKFKFKFFTQFYLKSTQFYHILLSFTSSGTQFYQIPPETTRRHSVFDASPLGRPWAIRTQRRDRERSQTGCVPFYNTNGRERPRGHRDGHGHPHFDIRGQNSDFVDCVCPPNAHPRLCTQPPPPNEKHGGNTSQIVA